ncbi:MAG: response regulator [Oscillospiraceae bacterium]|nr:response regulator [Oscillospiraceae bacterium]
MKRLLLINSSQVLMDITKKILQRAGYTVRCAVGAKGAREILTDYSPDGIILDNELPDTSGIDFFAELRSKSAAPIMIVSNEKDDALPALQAGASDFLKKPFDYDIMAARIEVMLSLPMPAAPAAEADTADAAAKETPGYSGEMARTDAQKPAMLPNLTPPAGKRKLFSLKHVYMAAVACIVCVLIGVGMLNLFGPTGDFIDIPEDDVPMGFSPFLSIDGNAKPYTGDEPGVSLPVIGDVTIPAGALEVRMLLYNPAGSASNLSFEIILTGGGEEESIFETGLIEPGMCIEDLTLSKGLAKGEYPAVLRVRAYSLDDYSFIFSADTGFTITAA